MLPPVDNTPPQIAITAPADGATVHGVFTITADATDDGEVAGVQFQVDGNDEGAEVTLPPYSRDVNSYFLANGPHTLTAVARDTADNTATSDEVSIEVDNPPPQNVVIILSDDQRFDLMQYMPLTSNLLNAETVRFTRGFVTTSLCCPSRSSILTGRFAHNHGVLTNLAPTGGATKFNPSSTIATWLHQAGYRTGLIGKYLNQYQRLTPAVPPGWDDFRVFDRDDITYYDQRMNENGTQVMFGTAPADYATELVLQKARQFILSTPDNQPLFLMMTPFTPHAPATPYPTDKGSFATLPAWRPPSFNELDVSDKPAWVKAIPRLSTTNVTKSDALHRRQVESLQSLDRAVATIVSTLQQTGRWGSTLLFYLSDNGLSWGEHRLFDRKICPYEECIRVPFWVRMPGLASRSDASLVANIDLAPTIAAWAGITPPSPVNGMNLLPLLQNPNAAWRSALLIEHLGSGVASTTSSGVRTARYFYNEYQNGNRELYDLQVDPYELTNVSKKAANAALVASLRATLNVLKAQ